MGKRKHVKKGARAELLWEDARKNGARVLPSPGAPYDVANFLLRDDDIRGLSFAEGSWWRQGATGEFEQVPMERVHALLYEILGAAAYRDHEVEEGQPGDHKRWNPNRSRVREVEESLRAWMPREAGVLPAVMSLRDLLAQEDDEEAAWRIEGLLAAGARAMLAAPHKAGKSTIVGNLLRALADGRDFLGRFEVRRAKRVVLIDDELDPRTLRAWLADHAIDRTKRIEVVSLRGRVSSFDILTAEGRRRWAEHIGRCDVLILDCVRPILDAFGLDENRDGGRFTVALDELLALVGPSQGISPECVAVHHTGHAGERSRGDSRFLDWPDAIWRIAREDVNDPASDRFFAAFGRDVAVPEGRLEFDPETRALTLGEGSRKEGKLYRDMLAAAPEILAYVTANPGASGAAIEEGVSTPRGVCRQTITALVGQGVLVKEKRSGRGGGFGYRITEPGEEIITSPTSPKLAAADFTNLAKFAYRANGGVVRTGNDSGTSPSGEDARQEVAE